MGGYANLACLARFSLLLGSMVVGIGEATSSLTNKPYQGIPKVISWR